MADALERVEAALESERDFLDKIQMEDVEKVARELRARRKFCEIYQLYGPSQRARLRDAFEEMEKDTNGGGR